MAIDTGVPLHMINFQVTGENAKPLPGAVSVELSDLTPQTSSLSGSGIAGTTDEPITGALGGVDATVSLRTQTDALIDYLSSESHQLSLTGVLELDDPGTGTKRYAQVKAVIKGRTKSTNIGKFVSGAATEPKMVIAANYVKVSLDGSEKFEFDRFAMKYVVNGTDLLEEVRTKLNS